MTDCRSRLVIWCLEDDRQGHRRQLAGLAQALRSLRPVQICPVGRGTSVADLPAPDLILTAGRRSHWRGLYLRWCHGGKLVALMNPGLPRPLFDLCIIPEHDGLSASRKVLLSLGPLNPVAPATAARTDHGLILVGGPSRHYHWDNAHLMEQLRRLQLALPQVSWVLTSSRRTPASFLSMIRQQPIPGLQVVPAEETEPDWLPQHYARSGVIWVTEDSASMVYESLSCGAAVGILAVPARRAGRVGQGIRNLLQQGRLQRLDDLEARGRMSAPQPPLQEATRIAREIDHWLE